MEAVKLSTVPAFLNKLWNMVCNPKTDHLIKWSACENSFVIQNRIQFWYELLPVYYKHNNMSSFIRQLNMYGFHKKATIDSAGSDQDKEELEFYHPFFQKDHPELLKLIKRKVAIPRSIKTDPPILKNDEQLYKVISDVKNLRGKQASVDNQLGALKHENAVLWRELAILRQKHTKQQQIVNKLIQFLVSIVHSNRVGVGVKRHYPLMIKQAASKKQKTTESLKPEEGPTIRELDDDVGNTSDDFINSDIEIPVVSLPLTPASQSSSGIVSSPDIPLTLLEDVDEFSEDVDDSAMIDPNFLFENDETNEVSQAEKTDNNENKSNGDTVLSDIMQGSYSNVLNNGIKSEAPSSLNDKKTSDAASEMIIAKPGIATMSDLDLQLEKTQSEIEQLRDILNNCSGLDANALLKLFADEGPDYGLSFVPDDNLDTEPQMTSNQELQPYGLTEFDDLFTESLDDTELPLANILGDTDLNTPQPLEMAPDFMNDSK